MTTNPEMSHHTSFDQEPAFTIETLIELLTAHGIDFSLWGKGGAKSIEELFEEVTSKECELLVENGELIRQVHVACIDVSYTDSATGLSYKLTETLQEWHDGSGRSRSRDKEAAVTEKMYIGENSVVAALRGIEEELNLKVPAFSIRQQPDTAAFRTSFSYPNIRSRYTLHNFILQLPDEYFNIDGYMEDDGRKYTYFAWILK